MVETEYERRLRRRVTIIVNVVVWSIVIPLVVVAFLDGLQGSR